MNIQALQTLLSNPAAMSVESLERAHREESRTPTSPVTHTGHGNYVQMPPLPAKATVANDLESDLKNKLNISKTGVVGKHKGLNYQENKSIEEKQQMLDNDRNNQSYAGAAKSPNKKLHKVTFGNHFKIICHTLFIRNEFKR